MAALVVSIVVRWLVGWLMASYTGDVEACRALLWLPLRDMLSAAVWFAGATGRRVIWRGETYLLQSDGQMTSKARMAEQPDTAGSA
jgi:hypothetical protein